MNFKVSLQATIRSVKICVQFIICWIPPLNVISTTDLIHRNTLWNKAFCCSQRGLIVLLTSACQARGDAAKLTKIFFEIAAMIISILKVTTFMGQHSRLQICILGMAEVLKTASFHGSEMLEHCEDRFVPLYSFFATSVALLPDTACSSESMLLVQRLASNFYHLSGSKDLRIIKAVLYCLEVVATFQSIITVAVNLGILELLQWFIDIRIELLTEKFLTVIERLIA